MNNIEDWTADFERSAVVAEKALEISFSEKYSNFSELGRHTWASATFIHCDVLRYFVAFQTATHKGVARLLWIGDIVCALYEARRWFFDSGNQQLLSIAGQNGYGVDVLKGQLRSLKKDYPLGTLDSYSDFRNKAGHHYDADLIRHVWSFSKMELDPFVSVLSNYSKFSSAWLKLAFEVIKTGVIDESSPC